MSFPIPANLHIVKRQTFAGKSPANSVFGQRVNGPLLKNARPNASQDIFAAAAFEDNGTDAIHLQYARKEQPRWTGPSNAYLRFHYRVPCFDEFLWRFNPLFEQQSRLTVY